MHCSSWYGVFCLSQDGRKTKNGTKWNKVVGLASFGLNTNTWYRQKDWKDITLWWVGKFNIICHLKPEYCSSLHRMHSHCWWCSAPWPLSSTHWMREASLTRTISCFIRKQYRDGQKKAAFLTAQLCSLKFLTLFTLLWRMDSTKMCTALQWNG